MQCRNCGIEIADKALICYRCGTSTTEAKFKPVVPRRSSSSLVASVLALALLVLLALYLGRFSWIAVAVAAVVIVLQVYGRRLR